MTVPVLWVSWHDDIIARGYYDQGFLEALFAREVWTPPSVLTFEHHEVRNDFGETFQDGGVVILPARHHTSEEDVQRFINNLDEMAWSLVILSGDEEVSFPWRMVPETDTRKVWIMQPRPEHSKLSGLIPGGWYPSTYELVLESLSPDNHRPLDWFFAGQVTHARRHQCVKTLRKLRANTSGSLIETEGYLQGVPRSEYFDILTKAKVVPCPSGPMTVDTARPLEALEAGCVPVVDMLTPRGDDYDYWTLVFGFSCPFARISDWNNFPLVLRRELFAWPTNQHIVFSFWQQWKRNIALQLDNDIYEISGLFDNPSTEDLISVIVTTSPAAIHPSTDHIEQVVSSIREQLPNAEIIIAIDGIHPEDEPLTDAYNAYVTRLLYLCNFVWHNVVPVFSDTWQHQANMTRRALEFVNTPLVLFVEHDTPITGDIDWPKLAGTILSGRGNVIQLHFNESIHPDHRHLLLEDEPVDDLYRTTAWWQRPHLASTTFYEGILDEHFPKSCRTMIEDKLYGIYRSDVIDNGPDAWDNWRVFVYAPESTGSIIRSRHLDSRGHLAKHEMRFE